MKQEIFVYRTRNADVVAGWKDMGEQKQAWSKRIEKWAREKSKPDKKRRPIVNDGHWDAGGLVGLEAFYPADYGKDAQLPEGWRLQKNSRGMDYLVPRMSLKAGKALAAEIGEINRQCPDMRRLPGMPRHAGIFASPGVELREDGQALYVLWSSKPYEGDDREDRVNFEIWEKVPLSEYWAVVEREAPDEAAATG